MKRSAEADIDVSRWLADDAPLIERQAVRVLACEPAASVTRTRDVIQVDVTRGEHVITLLVTAEALEVRLPTIEWATPYSPADSTRLWKRALWRRLDSDSDALNALIDSAFDRRAREFVPCRSCREPTPPERRHGRVCHGCAEAHLGIDH